MKRSEQSLGDVILLLLDLSGVYLLGIQNFPMHLCQCAVRHLLLLDGAI